MPSPSAIVNLPNYITVTRIFCVPFLIWVLASNFFRGSHGEKELAASGVFILASMTDGLDGYLARKRQQVTTLGMLLDPLADKLLIAAAFISLVQFAPRLVPAWIAVVIIGREFLVSGLRAIAAQEGFTIQASDLGKLKMVVQIVSVVAVILAHRWPYWAVGPLIAADRDSLLARPSGSWWPLRWCPRPTISLPFGPRSTKRRFKGGSAAVFLS